MNRPVHQILLLAITLVCSSAHAESLLGPGDHFPEFEASDQHGETYRFGTDTRTVLIAFDMSSSKAANGILADRGAAYLDDHRAVFISNIYGMPGIGRVFAIPKMRKYPHRIVLADDMALLQPFPQRAGHITVMRLTDGGVIESVRFWDPAADMLEKYLE
ncbi:MAG: hypothetical protein R3E82_15850 [Pseudomonadales bacterium]